MKKALSVILIVAICLVVIGGAVFAIGMQRIGWDFTALSSHEYFSQSASFSVADVDEIVIDVHTEDVSVVTAESEEITIEYFIVKNKKGKVLRQAIPTLSDGVLRCVAEGHTTFLDFGSNGEEKVVVKIPGEKVVALSVKVSTGDVSLGEEGKERRYASLKVDSSTGDVVLRGKTTAETLSIGVSTGNVKLKGEIACSGDVEIATSTGEIEISAAFSAEKLSLKSSTGDVRASSPLTSDNISVRTSTGDVKVLLSGRKEDYTYLCETSTGDSNLPSFAFGTKRVEIHTSTGDIEVSFSE